jgi:hypothetical protein
MLSFTTLGNSSLLVLRQSPEVSAASPPSRNKREKGTPRHHVSREGPSVWAIILATMEAMASHLCVSLICGLAPLSIDVLRATREKES